MMRPFFTKTITAKYFCQFFLNNQYIACLANIASFVFKFAPNIKFLSLKYVEIIQKIMNESNNNELKCFYSLFYY